MNTPRILLFLLLTADLTRARAQDNPAPAATSEPAQTEMQKWIATTDAQWQAVFNREVTDVHAAELKDLALKYTALLDAGIAKVSAAGDLKDALVLRDEKKRFADTNVFPEKDDDADAASLKAIRAAIRVQLAKLETANAARTRAVHAKYDAALAQAQTQLTQRQRLDDALLVRTQRDEVAAAWITPAIAAAAEKATPPVTALAIRAKQPATATTVPGSGESKTALLRAQLEDSKWSLGSGKTLTCHADGSTTASWNQRKGTWKVTGANTAEMSFTNSGRLARATFDADFQRVTVIGEDIHETMTRVPQ